MNFSAYDLFCLWIGHGVVVKALDCRIVVSEFELQGHERNFYWLLHFRGQLVDRIYLLRITENSTALLGSLSDNTPGKAMNPTPLKPSSYRDIGPAVRVFANGPGDLGSIPGRVIPKTLKMELDTTLLNTQHYKVRFKGKVEQSREWSSALPYTLV